MGLREPDVNPDGFWGALGCPAASPAFALSLQDALGRAAPALGAGTRRVTGAAAPTGGARPSEDLGRPRAGGGVFRRQARAGRGPGLVLATGCWSPRGSGGTRELSGRPAGWRKQ